MMIGLYDCFNIIKGPFTQKKLFIQYQTIIIIIRKLSTELHHYRELTSYVKMNRLQLAHDICQIIYVHYNYTTDVDTIPTNFIWS